MDTLSPEQRKENMRRVNSKDTKAEMILRRYLWKAGIRYRKNYSELPGKPDIAITKHKIAVFVDGEFWHGRGYDGGDYSSHKYGSLREQLDHSSNPDFWKSKIERNMARDIEVAAELHGLGWIVLRFWSRDVIKYPDDCVQVITETIFERSIRV